MRDRVPWIGDDEQRLVNKRTQLWLSSDVVGGEEDVGGLNGKRRESRGGRWNCSCCNIE